MFCIDYTNKLEYYFTSPKTWVFWAVINLHDYLMYFLINVFVLVIVFIIVCLYYQQNMFKNYVLNLKNLGHKRNDFVINFVKRWIDIKYMLKLYNFKRLYNFNHAPVLELVWTLTPFLMIIAMGWPSFKVLYAMEQLVDPIHTIIIIGNQWYWTYNYSDYDIVSDLIKQLDSNNLIQELVSQTISFYNLSVLKNVVNKKNIVHSLSNYLRKFEESKIIYDCVILSDENLPKGYPRLLSTDQVLILPAYVSVRLLVTSLDVIHSWALPSHGLKMDAVPGRINQINFLTQMTGTFWGQCSEPCGINHGFMPIEVRVLFLNDYLNFISLNISYRQDKFIPIIEKFIKFYLENSLLNFKMFGQSYFYFNIL